MHAEAFQRVSILRRRYAYLLAMVAPALFVGLSPVAAQSPAADLGILATRFGLGVQAGAGMDRMFVFGRAEGFETQIITAGLRVNILPLTGGAVYGSAFVARGTCPEASIGGAATGCSGERHTLYGAAFGLDIRASTRTVLFAEIGRYELSQPTADIPPWMFAAGVRYRIIGG